MVVFEFVINNVYIGCHLFEVVFRCKGIYYFLIFSTKVYIISLLCRFCYLYITKKAFFSRFYVVFVAVSVVSVVGWPLPPVLPVPRWSVLPVCQLLQFLGLGVGCLLQCCQCLHFGGGFWCIFGGCHWLPKNWLLVSKIEEKPILMLLKRPEIRENVLPYRNRSVRQKEGGKNAGFLNLYYYPPIFGC